MTYDIIIIGSGCAGYTAALYSCRAARSVLLFTGTSDHGLIIGGQLTTTTEIENYPGIKSINGFDLMEIMKNQASDLGNPSGTSSEGVSNLKILEKTILSINHDTFPYTLKDEDNTEYKTRSIIIATGSTAKRLNLPNELPYWNHGISACAVCDGALPRFRNNQLIVVGGGDSAMEEATFLSKYASTIFIVNRSDKLRASKIMIDRVSKNSKIKIIYNRNVVDVIGNSVNGLTHVKLDDDSIIYASGLFYGIGHTPNTQFLKGTSIQLDNNGYIITKDKSSRTNIDGIFACGDVQDPKYKQAIVASGSGCTASLDAEDWLNSLSD